MKQILLRSGQIIVSSARIILFSDADVFLKADDKVLYLNALEVIYVMPIDNKTDDK